jgi:peroxiredoxin
MKANRIAALAACGLLAAIGGEAAALKTGEAMRQATVKMKNVDGRDLSIADVTGKNGTLVIFSCNHCPFVKSWEGRIAAIGNEYLDKGIGVIVINANDPAAFAEDRFEEMQRRAKTLGFRFPYVVDATSEVARAFGATKTPEVFLFDAAGRLVYHGAVDDNKSGTDIEKPYLRDALEALLAGKPVAVAETKFMGCAIKFRRRG